MIVGAIVEGHGDVNAVPELVRRFAAQMQPPRYPSVVAPLRVPRTKLVKQGEIERAVELMARKVGAEGAILVLVDADDDCPADLGPDLLQRARSQRPDRGIAVVLAKVEFEAWFLAAASSLAGKRGLPYALVPPADAEGVRDAKGWLDSRMANGYSETADQAAFASLFSFAEARAGSSSFRKFERDLLRLLASTASDDTG